MHRQLCTSVKSLLKNKLKDDRKSKNKSSPKVAFHCPIDSVIIEKWSQAPGFNPKNPSTYLKKLLVYYPKDSKALRPLNMFLTSKNMMQEVDKTLNIRVRKLVQSVVSKYKKVFLRQLCVGVFSRTCFPEKLVGATERVIVFPGLSQSNRSKLVGKKFFVNNKRLKSVILYEDSTASSCISTWLQYSPVIESITIRNLPYLSYFEQKRVFLTSKSHLEKISILGFISDLYNQAPHTFICLLNLISNIKTLNRFKLDVETYVQLDLDEIPFEKFKENNISYDIRTLKYRNLKSPKNTISGLTNLDALALNLRIAQISEGPTIQACRDELQKYARNILHLNFYDKFALNLSFLLEACKHISTLDLITPVNSLKELDFGPLQNFDSLKHIYIRFSDFHSNIINLFDNLAICFDKNSTLKTLFLYPEGSALQGCCHLVPLFETCATSLTSFSIALSSSEIDINVLECLFQSLKKINSLKSFKIFSETATSVVHEFINLATYHKSLEEFYLSMPLNNTKHQNTNFVNLAFKNPQFIKKLHLEIDKLESISAFQESFSNLKELTTLKLKTAELSEETWRKLVHMLKTMDRLENFILQTRPKFDLNLIKADLNLLFEKLSGIKQIIFNKLCDYYYQEGAVSFVLQRTNSGFKRPPAQERKIKAKI